MKPLQSGRRQRGVGAVLIVMVLFFLMSLVAAYANRNLIFEQKTSANQTRATMAFEAADAGIEWTLAQLNGGIINGSCEDSSPSNNFQQRYLSVDANGYFTHATRAVDSWPTCVFNGTDWTCRCPGGAAATPPSSTGAGPFPSFRVWPATKEPTSTTFSPYTAVTFPRPGIVSVASAGCSVLPATANLDSTGGTNSNCLSFLPRGDFGEGVGTARAYVGLRSGLVSPPTVAVMARGSVTPATGPAKLKLVNTDQPSGGFTINIGGGPIDPALFDARTIAGTPGPASFADQDQRLSSLNTLSTGPSPLSAGERMFVAMFGVKRQAYKDQPGLRVCTDPCTSTQLTTLLTNNPNRIIWVAGNLTLAASTVVGSASAPVLLIVDGDTLTLNADVQITGFVYLTGAASATSTINLPAATPAPTITGALVAEGNLVTTYASTPSAGQELTIAYDAAALNVLRTTYGSWVRMVGSWRDFKEVTP